MNFFQVNWQRELLNAFVNDKSTTSSTTSNCQSLKGVYLFRLNQLVETEELLIFLTLRYLPFLEHLLTDFLNNNSVNQNNKKIENNQNNKSDINNKYDKNNKISKISNNLNNNKKDFHSVKMNKIFLILQKLRNAKTKGGANKKGKSKINVAGGDEGREGEGRGGEEEGENIREDEVRTSSQ